jgi:hypothetical protein
LDPAGHDKQLFAVALQVRQVYEQGMQLRLAPSSKKRVSGHWHWKVVLLRLLPVVESHVAHLLTKLVTQVKQVAWQVWQRLVAVIKMKPVWQSQVEAAVLRVRFKLVLQVRQVLLLLQVRQRELHGAQSPEELAKNPILQSQVKKVVFRNRFKAASQVAQVLALLQVRQVAMQAKQTLFCS